MSRESPEDPQSVAIEQLKAIGLSTYAARTFVALVTLETGTAREVNQVSAVPRTKVYDAIDELHERGLVEIQQSSPKRFWAPSTETTSQTLEHEFQHRMDILRTALTELEPVQQETKQRGVSTADGQTAVTERVLNYIASASEEIVYMTVEDILTEELIAGLREAANRGVAITFGCNSPTAHEHIRDEIPSARAVDSLWGGSAMSAGRLMMVDSQKVLLSARTYGNDSAPSDPRTETAIWGERDTNSVVGVLQAIVSGYLDTATRRNEY